MEFNTQFQVFLDRVLHGVPDIIAALFILLVGWLIARGLKALTVRLLKNTKWDEKLMADSKQDSNVFFGNIVYFVIMIFVLLLVLDRLGIDQVLTPVENMVNKFLLVIPNIIGAGLVGFIGYLIAKFVSNLIYAGGNFLGNWIEKAGIKDTEKLMRIIKNLVFLLIFIPILIQALNILGFRAISDPANDILYSFVDMIGEVIMAIIVLFIFGYGGRFLANLVKDILKSVGIDKLSSKIGIQNMLGATQSLASIIANLLFFFIMFFGVITAVDILNLEQLSEILQELLYVTSQILFGLVIIAVGNYISKLIYDAMLRSENNKFLASIVRYAALFLFLAIALRTMGIANSIIELAFGLFMGAIAVAIALSYGLGGREAAGNHFKEIIDKLRNKDNTPFNDNTPPTLKQ